MPASPGRCCRRWQSGSARRKPRLPPSEAQAQLLEVFPRTGRVAAERDGVDFVLDAPAEEHAAHAELLADPERLSGRLPFEARPVDGSLARHDEVGSGGSPPAPPQLHDG